MNVRLMKICTPLSPSLQIFRPVMTKIKYMYTTTRACTLIVNMSVIIDPFRQYSRNGNLSTLILIPTLPKPTAYFSVISSWRFLSPDPKRIGGYSDQPGVRPSVRLSVRLSVRRQKLVRSITFIPFEIF